MAAKPNVITKGGGNKTEIREMTAWVPSAAADFIVEGKSGTDQSSTNYRDPTFNVKVETAQLYSADYQTEILDVSLITNVAAGETPYEDFSPSSVAAASLRCVSHYSSFTTGETTSHIMVLTHCASIREATLPAMSSDTQNFASITFQNEPAGGDIVLTAVVPNQDLTSEAFFAGTILAGDYGNIELLEAI